MDNITSVEQVRELVRLADIRLGLMDDALHVLTKCINAMSKDMMLAALVLNDKAAQIREDASPLPVAADDGGYLIGQDGSIRLLAAGTDAEITT